jgi:hypothetical protein
MRSRLQGVHLRLAVENRIVHSDGLTNARFEHESQDHAERLVDARPKSDHLGNGGG